MNGEIGFQQSHSFDQTNATAKRQSLILDSLECAINLDAIIADKRRIFTWKEPCTNATVDFHLLYFASLYISEVPSNLSTLDTFCPEDQFDNLKELDSYVPALNTNTRISIRRQSRKLKREM